MHPYMNRHDRRQARRAEGRRPRAGRMARPMAAPMIMGSEIVMRPLEQLFDELDRTGKVSVNAKGYPTFVACDGHKYEAAPAIEGLIWHFEMWSIRHAKELPLQPLRDLYIALHYLVPIQERTIEGLRHALPILRRVIALGQRDDQGDLFHQTRIKIAMEAQA
ncbi:hypothetical protein AX27061_3528 [Achromobacter xylosoxidans NBRC 15126 = ATCC 27061]|nr:hypothetical protein AX27061_3528 [Achromobacter xylosoxidans NBRC 15126 = ATCC 27061]CKH66964.1 Uncharacterised protein [Achromobacter xylosoxidans]